MSAILIFEEKRFSCFHCALRGFICIAFSFYWVVACSQTLKGRRSRARVIKYKTQGIYRKERKEKENNVCNVRLCTSFVVNQALKGDKIGLFFFIFIFFTIAHNKCQVEPDIWYVQSSTGFMLLYITNMN